MNRLHSSFTLASLCTVAMLGLVGCAGFGAASFPDASANPAATSIGSISGSVYGGHAPLVGAHVYVLQPSTTGYGGLATSLLSSTYNSSNKNASGAAFSTTLNASDPNVPTTWYYETTDITGSFNIGGDYTCTADVPVYLYAYGGSPTYPSASNVFSSTQFTVESAGGTGPYVYTLLFNTTTTELFYEGETVTLSGYTGGYTSLNGTTGKVLAGNLTTNQFEITIASSLGLGGAGSVDTASGTITASPETNNPAVVNLAVLGMCPSTGSLAAGGTIFNGSTSSAIPFVFMNEISTVATAFAFEGFSLTGSNITSTTNATRIGTSSGNLIGLQNAALNAGLLYNINGPYVSTLYAGEGHIANPETPNSNGSVPQNLLDTLGNILAACVDSNNTSAVDGNANESVQCTTLFENATSNGLPTSGQGGSGTAGTIPIDTAQAAFNIAHYPAGDINNSSTFVGNLYSLPTGNVPYTPNLSSTGAGQPSDFTVAIQYPENFTVNSNITSVGGLTTNNFATGAESLAIDGYGNVWVDSITNKTVYEISAQGVPAYTATDESNGTQVGYVTIDPSNNVWWGNHSGDTGETEVTVAGTANLGTLYGGSAHSEYYYNADYGTASPFNAAGFFDGYASVSNWSGDIFIGVAPPSITSSSQATTTGQWYTAAITGTAGSQTNYITQPVTLCSSGCVPSEIGHGAVQNQTSGTSHGNIWWTGEYYDWASSDGNAASVIALVSGTSGAVQSNFPIFGSGSSFGTQNASIKDPQNLAVDSAGNAWVAAFSGNTVLKVTGAGSLSSYTGSSLGVTLTDPFAVAIDGAGNAFVTNDTSSSGPIAVFNTTNLTEISPSGNYTLGGQLTYPLNDAFDQSGNLWITSNEKSLVVQWIGAGLPVGNPLSKASANGTIGTTP